MNRPRPSSLRDRVSQAYHDFGRVCSAHPVACLSMSLLTMMFLSYPAVARFRLPPSSPIDVHWSDRPTFSEDDSPPSWLSSAPAVFLQQIIVRASVEPWNSLNLTAQHAVRGPLSLSFHLHDVIVSSDSIPSACLHLTPPLSPSSLLPNGGCLLLSPHLFWNDKETFMQDPDVISTVFQRDCSPSWCPRDMLLGIPTGMTGIKRHFQTNRKRSIDYSLSLFLAEYDSAAREALKQKLAKDLSSLGVSLLHSKEADETTFVHVFYRPRKYFADYFPIVSSFIVSMLYIYYSARKFEMVASRWGLSFAAAFNVAATLLMTTGICAHLDLLVTLWSAEIFPYIALILSLENTLCITRSVVNTPPSLDVSSRIAHGLSQEGYSLCKYFLLEFLFLAVGYSTLVREIQEFCFVAAIGIVVDFYMQLFFYAPCLTFDLQRLNRADKLRFGRLLLSTEIPHLKTFPDVNCPMRRLFPRLFEAKRRLKRTFSDSHLEEDRELLEENTGNSGQNKKVHRRSISVSKPSDEFLSGNRNALLSDASSSARLRLLYFVTRTRIMQRSIMVIFAAWTVWLAFVVHSKRGDVPSTGFGISHRVLETAPQQWGEWQRRTFKWWPVLFAEYNISLSGHYVTFLPPIVLKAKISPLDPMLISVANISSSGSQSEKVGGAEPLTGQSAGGFSSWLESQLSLWLLLLFFSLVSSVVLFLLYVFCVGGRWRRISGGGWSSSTEKQDKKSCPHYLDTAPTSFCAHRFPIECLSISSPSRFISACQEGKICLWDADTGERLLKLNRLRMPSSPSDPPPPVPPPIWAMDASDSVAVIGCADGSLEVACLARNKLIGVYHQSRIGIAHLLFSASSVVAARLDGSLDFIQLNFTIEGPLRVSSMRLSRSVRAHSKPVSHLLLSSSSEGNKVLTASHDHTLKVFDLLSGDLLHTLSAHSASLLSVCLSAASSNSVFSACEEGLVCCWDISTGQLVHSWELSIQGLLVLSPSPSSPHLSIFSGGSSIRTWDLQSTISTEKSSIEIGKPSCVDSVCLVSLSDREIAISDGAEVSFWSTEEQQCMGKLLLPSAVDRLLLLTPKSVLCICGTAIYLVNVPVIRKK